MAVLRNEKAKTFDRVYQRHKSGILALCTWSVWVSIVISKAYTVPKGLVTRAAATASVNISLDEQSHYPMVQGDQAMLNNDAGAGDPQVQKTSTLEHQEQQQLDVAAEACSRLEQALGLAQSMDSSFMPLSTRVGAVTEMAEMMTAEMQSMQEQHSAAVALHSLDAEALSASRQQLQRQQVTALPHDKLPAF